MWHVAVVRPGLEAPKIAEEDPISGLQRMAAGSAVDGSLRSSTANPEVQVICRKSLQLRLYSNRP